MSFLAHDLRFCLRSLRRRPGFTALAVGTIALGIGANVAIFSVVHAVLLRPLPYHEPDRLVHILNRSKTAKRLLVSHRDVADYWERADLFEAIGARGFTTGEVMLTGGDEVVMAPVQQITDNLFSLLGVEPALGRNFLPEDKVPFTQPQPEDTTPPTPASVIISHGLWQRNFGGDPDILERTLQIYSTPAVVVGVMPEGFSLLTNSEATGEPLADMWIPIAVDFSTFQREWGRSLVVLGRMRPGVTVEQAQAQMDAIAAWLQEEVEDYRTEDIRIQVLPLHHDVVKGARPTLLMLTGAVGFLLLLACANVANLMLVRARGRSTELCIRASLGCGRRRLAAQVLTESGVLAAAGGVLGVAMAWLGVRSLLALAPSDVPRLDTLSVGWPVLLFAVGASGAAALLFGVVPALQAGAVDICRGLKEGARSAMGGRGGRMLGRLVSLEVASSLVLLAGAALMVQTFVRLQEVRPGFDPEGVLTFNVTRNVQGREAYVAFFQEAAEAVGSLPGVEFAGSTSHLPMDGGRYNGPWAWDEQSEADWMSHRAAFRFVSGDFFRAMGTRLLTGRTFNALELSEESTSVIVDEILARTAWPNESPLGKSVLATRQKLRREVVGVVEHIRHRRLATDSYGTIYFPAYFGGGTQILRTSGDPMALAGPVREALRPLGSDVVVHQVRPMTELVDAQLAPTRFALLLMTIFSGAALLLAAVGLYGVISYAVRQRTAEIGLRMALGADRGRILGMVVRQGAVLLGLGAVGGLLGSLALTRFIRSLLFEVDATDPATLGAVTLLVGVVGLLALWVPAARGARTDPVVALRTE